MPANALNGRNAARLLLDARHGDAVDRHRQIDAVERAGCQHAIRHDVAVDAAHEVAAPRADVGRLRPPDSTEIRRAYDTLKLCVVGHLNESGVGVLMPMLPMRSAKLTGAACRRSARRRCHS